jgi:hypothetical protein
MSITQGTPSGAEVVRLALNAFGNAFNVACPGRVESYDASNQTATVVPQVRRVVPGPEDGEDLLEDLPAVQSVPVLHPRGGGFFVHVPIQAGDFVLLVFLDRDPSAFRSSGQVSNPPDQRLHSLAHAVAIPGLFPAAQTIGSASASNLVMGKDGAEGLRVTLTAAEMQVGGSSDSAALASKVDSQLNNLKTAINGWAPVSNDGGAALKAALTAWLTDTSASGSTKLKVGG